MIPTLYQGSVKNILGPLPQSGQDSPAVLFQFTDLFSAFDWGRMPDAIPDKGASLAVMTAELYTQVSQPKTWQDFSKSQTALEIRKGISGIAPFEGGKNTSAVGSPAQSLGATFNEVGERLQREGMITHFLGASPDPSVSPVPLSDMKEAFNCISVSQVKVTHPLLKPVMGRSVLDYQPLRQTAAPKLLPLEVIYRFSCPPGSSLLKVLKTNPGYLTSLGVPQSMKEAPLQPNEKWNFPLVELFTKLESSDRRIGFTEALAIFRLVFRAAPGSHDSNHMAGGIFKRTLLRSRFRVGGWKNRMGSRCQWSGDAGG